MTSSDNPEGKISTISRVLAWILAVCSVLGIAGWIVVIYKSGQPRGGPKTTSPSPGGGGSESPAEQSQFGRWLLWQSAQQFVRYAHEHNQSPIAENDYNRDWVAASIEFWR